MPFKGVDVMDVKKEFVLKSLDVPRITYGAQNPKAYSLFLRVYRLFDHPRSDSVYSFLPIQFTEEIQA